MLWNKQDPPSVAEQLRNDRIFSLYQTNRNPFVDHPEWVDLVFAPAFTNAPRLNVALVSNGVTLYWLATNQTTQLEFSTNVAAGWGSVTNTPLLTNGDFLLSLPLSPDASFFRLRVQ